MKTEMVVRGVVSNGNLKDVTDGLHPCPRCSTQLFVSTHNPTVYDLTQQPVTLLLHGEKGEVGGLTPGMVDYLRNTGAGGTFEDDELIATAIANILNPEVSDG